MVILQLKLAFNIYSRTSYSKQDIEWFLGEANQHCVMKPSSQLLNNSTSTMDISETAMYKKYLCLILKSNSNPETVAGPLLMYDTLVSIGAHCHEKDVKKKSWP